MLSRQCMSTLMRSIAIIVAAANMAFSQGIEEEPLAWIHFTKYDKKVALFNNFYMYYVGGVEKIEIEMRVDPDPKHKLAFMWICKESAPRSMKIAVNGKAKVVERNATGNGKQPFFWDVIPVAEFGIDKAKKGKYTIVVTCPDEAQNDGILGGVRLIADDKQLENMMLSSDRRRTRLISPGTMSEEERKKTRIDRTAARERVLENWVAKKKLSKTDIQKDEFLAAAVKFANTVVEHGRDEYGPEKSPMFVQFLHRDVLKSPATLGWLRPDQGGPSHPIIPARFERSQNLLRLLVSLSSMTGDGKYAQSAMDATICMFEDYAYPNSGLIVFGNHMTIDLAGGRAYSDARANEQFELEDVFPFYEFFHDVSPEKTSRFVKGIWEAYTRDWHSMRYNRHASFNEPIDFQKTWDRTMTEVKDLPTHSVGGELPFVNVAYDIVFGGYTLGCVAKDARPRLWANRYLEVIAYNRDPKTEIWPVLLYPPPFLRRGLEVFVEAYPDSNATEARVIIGSWVYSQPIFIGGALGTIEQARRYGHHEEVEKVHRKIDEWVLGYMEAAYDRESHALRSIILNGQDVTNHVFTSEKTLYGWGAAPGKSFGLQKISSSYHAAIAQAYRLSTSPETKKQYWGLLRDLFKGSKLGDIGENCQAQPVFNYHTNAADQDYVFALCDIYRVTKNAEVLKFMEHLGRNIIKQRQDPKTGLFAQKWQKAPPRGNLWNMADRPTVAFLNVVEPHALLAIHGCRTGQFEKIPSWISIAMSGHGVGPLMESWFDRKKLEKYYEDQKDSLKERGLVVTDEWYPDE